MIKPLLFELAASQELGDAARWYEEQRSGLGQRFLDAVAATLDRPVVFPTAGMPVPYVPSELAVRRAPVKRFPIMSSTSRRQTRFVSWRWLTIAEGRGIGSVDRARDRVVR